MIIREHSGLFREFLVGKIATDISEIKIVRQLCMALQW